MQRKVAEETVRDADAAGHWPGKIVTEISEAGPFWEAEAEEQDHFQRHPYGYQFLRLQVEAASCVPRLAQPNRTFLRVQAGQGACPGAGSSPEGMGRYSSRLGHSAQLRADLQAGQD